MIILRLLGLLANGIADASELPRLRKAAKERENSGKCVGLVVNRQKKLASSFREHMTKDQLYLTSSPNRSTFYKRVIARANQVIFLSFPVFVRMTVFLQFVENSEAVEDEEELEHGPHVEGPQKAGEALCRFIDEHRLLDSKNGPRWPLVVLAFDEADALTDNPPNKGWNLFSELRRVLRQIDRLPIFSLFLSTAGRFDKFSPVIRHDPSAQAREPDNLPLDPISEISFDDIAYPALKGTITIDNVVKTSWLSHLGRPLYVHPSYPFRELLSYQLE